MSEPDNVASFRLTASIAERRIQEIAKSTANVGLTNHAKERMAEREITISEVYRVLRAGAIDQSPKITPRGDWKCKMTLKLRGRRTVGVMVAMQWPAAKLVILTVEWEDGK